MEDNTELLPFLVQLRDQIDRKIEEINSRQDTRTEKAKMLSECLRRWEKNFQRMIPRSTVDDICRAIDDGISGELLMNIMDLVAERNVNVPAQYYRRIIDRCRAEHVTTVEEFSCRADKPRENATYDLDSFERAMRAEME